MQEMLGRCEMNCCKPEHVGIKEHGKMLKRIQVLENGRVPAKKTRDWKIEGSKKRITMKENKENLDEFEMGGFMTQKDLWKEFRERKIAAG